MITVDEKCKDIMKKYKDNREKCKDIQKSVNLLTFFNYYF